MSTPIRLLHFADLHVGMENYGKLDPQTGTSSRIRDFLDRLDEVVAYALSHEADLVIFAGDAFKTRDPDPTQQREFARRIKTLADQIPMFMLVGNHDIPGMAARATSIDIFRALEVPNIIIGKGISSQVVETRRGPVFLGWVPFPVRNRLISQEEHKGASVEELDRAVESLITSELHDLATHAAEHDMPRVLVGHFSVGGATFGSERSVMLGRDLVVPKSALADPAWDYVCFPPIQPILMADGSVKRIDQVSEGDQVMNHTGKADRVEQVTSHQYTGRLYKLSTYYLPSPALCVTPDHPVLAVRREQLLCPVTSRRARGLVCTTNNMRLSYPCNVCAIPDMPRLPQPEYIRASDLQVGDFLCIPIPKPAFESPTLALDEFSGALATESHNGRIRIRVKGQGWDESVPEEIAVNEDFARLSGYFVAEGSLMTSKRQTIAGIQFSFGKHETRYHQDVIDLAQRIFGKNCTVTRNKYGQSITLCISSRLIGEMYQRLFRPVGKGCQTTRLPDFMTRLPLPLQRQALIGAFRGDGHLGIQDKNRRRGLITYATTSEALAWQLWSMALQQGLSPALRVSSPKGPKRPSPTFTLDLYGTDAMRLDAEIFGKTLDVAQKTKRLCFRDENFLYVPIRSIETEEYTGQVFNLEVEQAHTYIAGGVAVHNCLGHIHKHQNLTNGMNGLPPIVYSGSLERIDFGEEREDKGFCWIELKRGQTEWKFVRVQARPFRTIRVDVREESDPTAAVVAEIQQRKIEGAVVRLQIHLGEAQEAALRLREIEAVLSQTASTATISKDVEREARIANLGPTPEALSPLQWTEHYFISKNKSPERVKRLMEAAGQVLNGE